MFASLPPQGTSECPENWAQRDLEWILASTKEARSCLGQGRDAGRDRAGALPVLPSVRPELHNSPERKHSPVPEARVWSWQRGQGLLETSRACLQSLPSSSVLGPRAAWTLLPSLHRSRAPAVCCGSQMGSGLLLAQRLMAKHTSRRWFNSHILPALREASSTVPRTQTNPKSILTQHSQSCAPRWEILAQSPVQDCFRDHQTTAGSVSSGETESNHSQSRNQKAELSDALGFLQSLQTSSLTCVPPVCKLLL